MNDELNYRDRIIRIHALCWLVGLSKSSIYARIDPKSPYYDETFPVGFKIGNGGRARARGWHESDVIQWIHAQEEREANNG